MFPVEFVPDAYDVSIAPADVLKDPVLCGRRDCAGSGRIACSEGTFGFGRGNACEGLSSRHVDFRDLPELVRVMAMGDVQDGCSPAVRQANGRDERSVVQHDIGDAIGVCRLDRHFLHGESDDAEHSLFPHSFVGVRGERASVLRGADQQGHAIGEQSASDPFPPNQYPSIDQFSLPSQHLR